MPIITIPFKGIRFKGKHTPASKYSLNNVVSHPSTGVKYIAYSFDVPAQIPLTDTSYWKIYDYRKTLNAMRRYDDTTRTFGTTYANGKTWDTFTKTAGTNVMLSWSCPFRNDTENWGGGYIDIQLSVDGGSYASIGSSGYDGGVMIRGADSVGTMSGTLLLDLDEVRDATRIRIRFRHRSFTDTVTINGSHGISAGKLGAFWSQITLREVEYNVI